MNWRIGAAPILRTYTGGQHKIREAYKNRTLVLFILRIDYRNTLRYNT